MVLGDKMRYYYRLWSIPFFELKVKRYYLKIINILQDIFYLILSYIYIFTGIKFKIGGSKK